MVLQATLTDPINPKVVCSLCCAREAPSTWAKSGFCKQWRRPRFLQVIVGSSRNPGHPRAPIWKGRVLSNESMRVVRELKRARAKGDDARLSFVLNTMLTRLLQFDMMAVLTELQRQNECDLVFKVFDIVRKEFWYKADDDLFSALAATLARNKHVEGVEKIYSLADADGLQPSVRFFTEVVSGQVGSGNVQKALVVYTDMRKAGFAPCNPAYGMLRKALESTGDIEAATALEKEFKEFNDFPGATEQEGEEADLEHAGRR